MLLVRQETYLQWASSDFAPGSVVFPLALHLTAFPPSSTANSTPATPWQQYFKGYVGPFPHLELFYLWSISSSHPNSDQMLLFFPFLLLYPYLVVYSLVIYSTNTYCLYNSSSPLIPLLLLLMPMFRTLQVSAAFSTSSDPLCITSSEPWTLSHQHLSFPCFNPGEQSEREEGRI